MLKELAEKIIKGNKSAIAKGISMVENEFNGYSELLKLLYSHTGHAYLIGITGPPGAGKSTITNNLIRLLVKKGYKVGVIAVDPTSPFTGGALLGDRIRMQEKELDENVFIRSMATRGSLGGLSAKCKQTSEILDASGKDFILIETVGVGQSELDIAQTADTTVVVLVPESGDAVQTMKAGLMEIGDIFVINKSDREGSDALGVALRTMLHLKMKSDSDRETPVVKMIALRDQGTDELLDFILRHRDYLISKGKLEVKRKEHLIKQINELVTSRLENNFWTDDRKNILRKNIDRIVQRELNPYDFAESLL
ncbi:MAG: methylmalonyl Co-A mutase-associated GTPase MeaB [Ignavibacteria bacterium]|nr:methylmalonyl Co-A mutase-associated GTPase MeaB [Ignavibacteria bacterium]